MKIVFAGNCQAYSLAYIYRELFAADRGETVEWIDRWDERRIDQWRRHMNDADTVVEQVFTGEPRVRLDPPPGASRIAFPDVRGNFLWPLGNVPRVECTSSRRKGAGPYTPEIGDDFLNDLIGRGIDPDEAVRRYLDLDIVRFTRLDRVVEVMLNQQHDRDAACGMRIADFIGDRLASERLFTTPGHPAAPLFRRLAEQVYERLGVDGPGLAAARARLAEAPFDRWTEAPIHPGVIAHLGLAYLSGDQLYQHVREGRHGFAECARRYVANEWSLALRQGCELFAEGRCDDALGPLRRGLQEAPRSAFGHSRQALAYRAIGRPDLAFEASARALELEPADGEMIDIHLHSIMALAG